MIMGTTVKPATSMVIAMNTLTTIIATTMRITTTITPDAIIQSTSMTMGVANDLEADCREAPHGGRIDGNLGRSRVRRR